MLPKNGLITKAQEADPSRRANGRKSMNIKKLFNVRAVAGALGLVAACAASSVSAGINWGDPITLFEDDDLDFLIQANGETGKIMFVGCYRS